MKNHFVTGATGFVGRHLIAALLRRGDKVFILVRPKKGATVSQRVNEIFGHLNEKYKENLATVSGDITKRFLGIGQIDLRSLQEEKIDILWHLAADLSMNHTNSNAKRFKCNVTGTKNVVEFANYLDCLLCHFSTLHVSGDAKVFSEYDFEIGQKFRNPHEQSKFLAEKEVRERSKTPFIVFRPGSILGRAPEEKAASCTMGYYRFIFLFFFFRNWIINNLVSGRASKFLLRILGTTFDKKDNCIKFPLLIIPYAKGVRQNLVSIDYVVRASIKIAFNKACYNLTFHLTHPEPPTFDFFLRSMLEDLSIKGFKLIPLPSSLFLFLFKLAYLLMIPYRGYLKSAQIYISYLTHDDKFIRKNADYFNNPPVPITRKIVKGINKHAFEKVFPKIDLNSY